MINPNCIERTKFAIGYNGENDVRAVQFDVTEWLENYGPGGNFTLVFKRPTQSNAYPCPVTLEGNIATWMVQSSDLQYVGTGQAQLVYSNDPKIKKTKIYDVIVNPSLEPGETPPAEYVPWINSVIEIRDEAVAAKDAAVVAQEKAEDALEKITRWSE